MPKQATGHITNTFSETSRNQELSFSIFILYFLKKQPPKHFRVTFALLYLILLKKFFLENK